MEEPIFHFTKPNTCHSESRNKVNSQKSAPLCKSLVITLNQLELESNFWDTYSPNLKITFPFCY